MTSDTTFRVELFPFNLRRCSLVFRQTIASQLVVAPPHPRPHLVQMNSSYPKERNHDRRRF